MTRVVVASGGFDPIHIGHVRYLQEARTLGDKLIVVLNNDHWLTLKKGYAFMSQYERKEILLAFDFVDEVIFSLHEKNTTDSSICEDLKVICPDVFAKGGDRTAKNIPEYNVCKELGIEMVFGVGHGGKVQSSSELVDRARKADPLL